MVGVRTAPYLWRGLSFAGASAGFIVTAAKGHGVDGTLTLVGLALGTVALEWQSGLLFTSEPLPSIGREPSGSDAAITIPSKSLPGTLGEGATGLKMAVAAPIESSEPVVVDFGVESDTQLPDDLLLCWVDPRSGKLHHFYPLSPGKTHSERATVGHVFVVLRKQARTTESVGSLSSAQVVAWYRPMSVTAGARHNVTLRWSEAKVWSLSSTFVSECDIVDPGYRVIVSPVPRSPLLSCHQNWELVYSYLCPPVPNTKSWNAKNQCFYVWGDVDFDRYGPCYEAGRYQVSPYKFNQIVPQCMTGICLCGHDAEYRPMWRAFDSWVIQASYYWERAAEPGDDRPSPARSYSVTGALVPVLTGEQIHTRISFDVATGGIDVRISAGAPCGRPGDPVGVRESQLTLTRPFPNDATADVSGEHKPGFSSWLEFFRRCQDTSSTEGVWANPVVCVETHHVDVATLQGVLPFVVTGAATSTGRNWIRGQWEPRLHPEALHEELRGGVAGSVELQGQRDAASLRSLPEQPETSTESSWHKSPVTSVHEATSPRKSSASEQGSATPLSRRSSSASLSIQHTPMTPRSSGWMQDDHSKGCTLCDAEFSIFLRRHHCRACGRLVCGDCSRLSRMFKGGEALRACRECRMAASP